MNATQRILIVRLGAMGDIIHAIPAATSLRAAFPEAKVGWIVEKRWRDLLDSNIRIGDRIASIVDTIHLVNTRGWRRSLLNRKTMAEIRTAFRNVRDQHYEVAVDFQGAIKSGLIAGLSGAPRRYGFADPWERPASLFYTNKIPVNAVHVVDRNLELASAVIGPSASVPKVEQSYFVTATDKELREEVWSSPYLIMNPGAGWGAKQWPVERYAEVARALGADGFRSVINFGPGEEQMADAIQQVAKGYAFARQLGISQLKLLMTRASLFIGGDTGPLHLAAALKIPVIALFGPTDPARTGPYGTPSIVLRDAASVTSHKRNRETEAGLMNISAEQVIDAARELLAGGRP